MYIPSFVVLAASFFSVATSLSIDLSLPVPSKLPRVTPEIAQAVQDKAQKYARYIDTHQWDKYAAEVALPNCTYDYRDHGVVILDKGYTYKWNTTQQFVDFFSMAFSTLDTAHHIGPGEFTFVSCDEVSAVFPIIYYSDIAKGNDATQGVTGYGAGHYTNTYKRKGSDWFMSSCSFNRLFEHGF